MLCTATHDLEKTAKMAQCNALSNVISTGKSLSEALIFASTNPQYDDRLFIVHENIEYLQDMLCTQIVVFF